MLTLPEIRTYAADFARNPGAYNDAQFDRAAFFLLADFLEVTRAVKLSETVDIDATANEADFSALAGFLPARIESVRVDEDTNYTSITDDLERVRRAVVMNHLSCPNASTGTPEEIGFTDSTTAKLYPAPAYDGTLTVAYSTMQDSWQLGTQGVYSNSTTYAVDDLVSSGGHIYRSKLPNNLNKTPATETTYWRDLGVGSLELPASITTALPDALLVQVLGYGIGAALQWSDPEHGYASEGWKRYVEWRNGKIGVGSISGNIAIRETLRR